MVKHIHLPIPNQRSESATSHVIEEGAVRTALTIKQRTQLMNSLRAMLAEFGVVAAQGYRGFAELRAHLASPENELPETLVTALGLLSKQFDALTPAIENLEDTIRQVAKADPDMRRLSAIPGVGFITVRSWRRSGMGASSPAGATSPPGRA